MNCPSLAPRGINPQPQTGQKRTEGNCSVKAMQGPNSDAEKGTEIIARFPGSYPDQGRSLTTCASSLPQHRAPGPGTAVSLERLLLLLLLAGKASALTTTTARAQPGPRGETEARGKGRAALTAGTHRSLLVPPAVFLPSARSPALADLVTWHCTVPSHPITSPCPSPHPGTAHLSKTSPPTTSRRGRWHVPARSQCQAGVGTRSWTRSAAEGGCGQGTGSHTRQEPARPGPTQSGQTDRQTGSCRTYNHLPLRGERSNWREQP